MQEIKRDKKNMEIDEKDLEKIMEKMLIVPYPPVPLTEEDMKEWEKNNR